MKNNKLFVLLLIFAIIARLLPHEPNFTPLTAIALFSSFYFGHKPALLLSIISLFISDIFIGFHQTMFWVYASYFLIASLPHLFKKLFNLQNSLIYAMTSSTLFFIITNFGVWISTSLYTKNLSGLTECFLLALPFFRNTLFSDLLFTTMIFIAYSLARNKIKSAPSIIK